MYRQLMLKTLVSMLFAVSLALEAEERPAPGGCGENELFVSLTSDDLWRASMGLNFSLMNATGGGGLQGPRPVTVFLSVEGVRNAVLTTYRPQERYSLTGKKPIQVLRELIDQGARVIVCPNCLERSGFKPWHVMPEAYIGGPLAQILACSTTQLSF